jgi:large subunit ribosomal protein L14
MIQIQTLLNVADNSGGKTVRCLKIFKKGANPRYAKIGDVIVLSIQKIRSKNKITSKVKKGDVLYGVIIKTRFVFKRSLGLSFSSQQNAVVLLNKQFKPLATRVLGLIPRELRNIKFSKVVSLSSGTF